MFQIIKSIIRRNTTIKYAPTKDHDSYRAGVIRHYEDERDKLIRQLQTVSKESFFREGRNVLIDRIDEIDKQLEMLRK